LRRKLGVNLLDVRRGGYVEHNALRNIGGARELVEAGDEMSRERELRLREWFESQVERLQWIAEGRYQDSERNLRPVPALRESK
jgi:hypothetical protein